MLENDAIRILDRLESLRLLAKVPLGRVVYTRQALPAVLPVNFFLDEDDSVLLYTSAVSDLVQAIEGAVVAFEADEFSAATRSGWSVVVTGRAGCGGRARRARTALAVRAAFLDARTGRCLRAHRVRVGHGTRDHWHAYRRMRRKPRAFPHACPVCAANRTRSTGRGGPPTGDCRPGRCGVRGRAWGAAALGAVPEPDQQLWAPLLRTAHRRPQIHPFHRLVQHGGA